MGVTPCSLAENNRCFAGIYCLYPEGEDGAAGYPENSVNFYQATRLIIPKDTSKEDHTQNREDY